MKHYEMTREERNREIAEMESELGEFCREDLKSPTRSWCTPGSEGLIEWPHGATPLMPGLAPADVYLAACFGQARAENQIVNAAEDIGMLPELIKILKHLESQGGEA